MCLDVRTDGRTDDGEFNPPLRHGLGVGDKKHMVELLSPKTHKIVKRTWRSKPMCFCLQKIAT